MKKQGMKQGGQGYAETNGYSQQRIQESYAWL